MALEDDYRAYRETIAATLRLLRPSAEVESATPEALEEELERFDPQVVISGGREDLELGARPVWIELSLAPTQPTKISVGKRYLERTNPTLVELLALIEEGG